MGDAEGHHEEFKMPKERGKGGFLEGMMGHRHMVVARGEVKGGEEARLTQAWKTVLDRWDGEGNFLGLLVEAPVIHALAELGMVAWCGLLVDYDYVGGVGDFGRADHASFQEALLLSLQPLNSLERDRAELTVEGGQALGIDLLFKEEGLAEIGFLLGEGLGVHSVQKLEPGAVVGAEVGLVEGELTYALSSGG